MRTRSGWVALAIFGATVSCSTPYDFDAWNLPIAPEARLIGLPEVPPEVRAGAEIKLVQELVIGGGDDSVALFGRVPPRIVPAPEGRVAVLDAGNHRVLVFGPDGEHQTTFGRRGQDPAEFGQPTEMFLGDDGLLRVWDILARRLSSWTLGGELVDTVVLLRWGGLIVPGGNGELVWRETTRTSDGFETHFLRVASDGTPLLRYASMPWPRRTIDPPVSEITNTEPDAWWVGTVPPAFASGADGNVYLSTFADYQVFAFAADGTMRWALQVDHMRPPIAHVEIDLHMAQHRRRFPSRTESQVDWPARQYALADIKIDGHGHVYVFPYVPKGTPTAAPRPVDVYSADGERLFSGTISGRNFTTASATYNGPMYEVAWQAAVDEIVYGLAENVATGNYEVVRFHLVEPF